MEYNKYSHKLQAFPNFSRKERCPLRDRFPAHPWADQMICLDTVDSTNTYAKQLAGQGAPHGTVVLANRQTGGRGRLGRKFSSPAGLGIYCSVVLR